MARFMKFELFVAIRYLKAKRKQAVISLITLISAIGVAAGVAALIIALAVNGGFRADLTKKLLGAQPHVSVASKERSQGITEYMSIVRKVEEVPGVAVAAPSLYQTVLVSGPASSKGVNMKGIIPEMETRWSALSNNMVEGTLNDFQGDKVIIGKELAKTLGTAKGDRIRIIGVETRITPLGEVPRSRVVEVAGVFSSGLYEYDDGYIYVPLNTAQRLLGLSDVVAFIDVKVNDPDQANAIGQRIVAMLGGNFDFEDWMSMNKSILQALLLEKLVMFVTIGLIVLVAALNIVGTLIMMVLEKTRDIAILLSMGATGENIRRIFILQGVIIGLVGTISGVIIGLVTSHFADKYHWISLAPDVYTIAYVPFKAAPLDSVMVAVSAILISFLATLYPSATASKLRPVEALRYE
jgi:lipoprotein-releasing system permease protein